MAREERSLGRDLVAEVLAARNARAKTPENRAGEEKNFRLFSKLTDLLREFVPSDQLSELSPLQNSLTDAERNEELSRREHQQFMSEISRRNKIASADHFLDAIIEKDGETVRAQIQLQPGQGDVSLEKPAAFTITLPDTSIGEVFVVREKSIQGDPMTVARLFAYLRYSAQISYRRQAKTS